jgi:hypothetical protein
VVLQAFHHEALQSGVESGTGIYWRRSTKFLNQFLLQKQWIQT